MLFTFSLREVTNCHLTANLCHKILSGEGNGRLTVRFTELDDTLIAKQILNGQLDTNTDFNLPQKEGHTSVFDLKKTLDEEIENELESIQKAQGMSQIENVDK